MNGDYGLVYKENFLNSAVRVPLIVRTPEMLRDPGSAGTVCEEMVELFDVGATLAELAGAEWNGPRFARSFAPLLRDPAAAHRAEALAEVHGEAMIQDREWKLALNRDGEPYLLFHLVCDPDEQRNLVTDPAYSDVLVRLQTRLLRRLMTSQVYRDMNGFQPAR
jgi:choline-sulfatase